MSKDPFDRYGTGSDYFLSGESEEKSLRNIEEQLQSGQRGKVSLAPWLIMAIVGIGLAILINEIGAGPETGPIAVQYFEPLPVGSVFRYGNNVVDNDAYTAYSSGDFKKAIARFGDWESRSVLDSFFLALCYEGVGEWNKALGILDDIDRNMPADWESSVIWYRALAQIGTGDRNAALEELDLLTDGNSEYAPQARQLHEAIQ